MFKRATKAQAKARLLFSGASGSGKTTAALTVAAQLGKRIAFIDTEAGSASLYADRFDFDVLELSPPYSPERFIEAIEAAEGAGYDVVVIDSITHEWSGPGGCLDIKTKLGDRFQDWAKVTPRHDRFIQSMMRSKCHVIATVRAKQGYSMDERGKVQKSGMDPQQRDGIDFEFTVCWNINAQHMAEAQKDRTRLFDGKPEVITAETGKRLAEWLNAGEAAPIEQEEDLIGIIRHHKLANKLVSFTLAKLGKDNLDECSQAELKRIKNYLDAQERTNTEMEDAQ